MGDESSLASALSHLPCKPQQANIDSQSEPCSPARLPGTPTLADQDFRDQPAASSHNIQIENRLDPSLVPRRANKRPLEDDESTSLNSDEPPRRGSGVGTRRSISSPYLPVALSLEALGALAETKVQNSKAVGDWLGGPTQFRVDPLSRQNSRVEEEEEQSSVPFVPPDPDNQVRVVPVPEKMSQKYPCNNCNRTYKSKSELR
jgi:hypothetical protein